MKKIFIVVLILLLNACQKQKVVLNKNKKLLVEKYKLNIIDSVSFPLDSFTPPRSKSFLFHQNFLSFVNNYKNSIYIYDYKSKKIHKKIVLDIEGDNGVGNIAGHTIKNIDSIYVYTYIKKTVYLVNSIGNVLDKYILKENDSFKYSPSPKTWTETPMILKNNQLFLGGNISGEYVDESINNRPVMASINLKTRDVNYFYHYPKIYSKANWGGSLFRWINYDFNIDNDSFIFSFPADHNIQITSDFISESTHYAGSKYFNDISSLNNNKLTYSKKRRRKHYATTPSYSSIIYDKYRKVYYRIAHHPVKDYIFRKNDTKQISIIILDDKFNWIGEKIVQKFSHSAKEYFVNEKGLHLKKYSNNEDSLTFSIFKLEKI